MKKEKEYGLFTAITMIVGIVIGSGIFFKSDNILVYTNGSILKGVLVFSIAAVGIIFGSLTIALLASRTTKAGGLITYVEEYVNSRIAGAFGWFQVFIYYPAILSVISWIVGVYICMLMGWKFSPEIIGVSGGVAFLIIFIINYFSALLGGAFQNFSTISKSLLIALLAIVGFIYGDPKLITTSGSNLVDGNSMAWIGALSPIAFSYDGWVVATSISHEIKDSKKNLPIALIVGPIFVLIAYVSYFVGISILVGPEKIMELGDTHVNEAITILFGEGGAKIFLIFILISVLGTLNGFTLGFMRIPYLLAIRNMFPGSKKVSSLEKGHHIPKISAKISFVISVFYIFLNYIVQKYNLIPNSDISEIPIVASYIVYIVLYGCVINLYRKGEVKGKIMGLIVPTIAILGSLIIIIGGLQNPRTFIYLGICGIVILIALIYLKKENNNID
ncbi:APC family permease [Fusobacterium sp.]|uniref:APC family permease n=1 Tax=Fusobacterium sp. TaxID=68766 RepID=UPI0026156CDB|nr:APC family permease [Fusobacterium sp.]